MDALSLVVGDVPTHRLLRGAWASGAGVSPGGHERQGFGVLRGAALAQG